MLYILVRWSLRMQRSTQVLTDCQYNMAKQLEKKLEFLWHLDGYIKDAEKDGN